MKDVTPDDTLIVRARAIHVRLIALWPDYREVLGAFEHYMRRLGLWLDEWDRPRPVTHDDLDRVEKFVGMLEADSTGEWAAAIDCLRQRMRAGGWA